MKLFNFVPVAAVLLFSAKGAMAEIQVASEHNANGEASAAFKFKRIPAPSRSDVASQAKFVLLGGEMDENGAELRALHDGLLPAGEDEPESNFFFQAGTSGGRFLVDLGTAIELKQVNSYSWHPYNRGPQVYKLYASDGKGEGFQAKPKKGTALDKCGWKLVASVDTRPASGQPGGQYGVSISDSQGALGQYRYLLFDICATDDTDAFAQTFYSEIDVVAMNPAAAIVAAAPADSAAPFVTRSTDDYCEISIDTSGAPDLKEWAEQKLAPVLAEWYPKLTKLMASEDYAAPKRFSIKIAPGKGVAATAGKRVTANADFLKAELGRQAIGSLLHEEVHVVQQYWGGRRNNANFRQAPGWLVEGIPDYIRWFQYEPQSHGADAVWLSKQRNPTLKYDAGYRMSANFLNWVFEHYDKNHDLLTRVNAVCRQGKYTDALWKEWTGKELTELSAAWKEALQKEIASAK